jgi:pimeloyl-ACP methyl ester carboxylesterase
MSRFTSSLFALSAVALILSGCGASDRALSFSKQSLEASAQAQKQAKNGAGFRVERTVKSDSWARIERLTSSYEEFPVEKARPNGKHFDDEVVQAFGGEFPASRDVLLHYGKNWESGKGTPVLLVHGSLLDANSSWIHPHDKEGLAKSLTAKGFRVFAVTFAHRHGDNYLWAEQVANAIARIKEVTGAKSVDVVAHSKGTVAVRALTSGVRKPWMRKYQGDIRRLVMVGGPHLGLDYPYRHSVVNLGLYPEKRDNALLNAPMSWTKIRIMGILVDTTPLSINGGYFPGQAQMLARWDHEYALPKLEQDWYTTYHGGTGFVSQSPGIDKAIADGGNFIEKLRKSPLDSKIQLAVLAGDQADMKNILNENSGPSDGVCFVKSATATDDMTAGGAKLIEKSVLHLNHMELIYAPEAKAWIAGILGR